MIIRWVTKTLSSHQLMWSGLPGTVTSAHGVKVRIVGVPARIQRCTLVGFEEERLCIVVQGWVEVRVQEASLCRELLQIAMALRKPLLLLLLVALSIHSFTSGSLAQQTTNSFMPFRGSKFETSFEVKWTESNVGAVNGGDTLQLSLTRAAGSTVSTTTKYLYGYLRASMKLMPGDSAGTVTTFYLSSQGLQHDEVDFEFLGNKTGQPYILQTNIFANGVGGREQRIYLWFDPSQDFHYYSVIWNHKTVSMYVDETLIRVFQNNEDKGQPFLNKQPMQAYSSIFDGSQWATRGGLDKIDYNNAPFQAQYTNFILDACAVDELNPSAAPCTNPTANNWWNAPAFQSLPADRIAQMNFVNQNYMVYDYCADRKRYPVAQFECTAPLQ